MNKKLFIIFLITTAISLNAFAARFYSCKSTYALCTTAPCFAIAGKKDEVSCKCNVMTGYSAATSECESVKKMDKGEVVYSRYYPVKGYAVCSNSRPWAWCLAKPCVIDKNNPATASCACSVVRNLGPYVIVTNKNTATTCTTGLISSATVNDITKITDFLKTQKQPKPFPIKIYK